jgi:hypothetical protein
MGQDVHGASFDGELSKINSWTADSVIADSGVAVSEIAISRIAVSGIGPL